MKFSDKEQRDKPTPEADPNKTNEPDARSEGREGHGAHRHPDQELLRAALHFARVP
jgi:hypothetical protein